jgi:1-acyl-sn-glycerol-3-phosphate acyltransferase
MVAGRGRVLRWLRRGGDPGWGTRLEDWDPAAVRATMERLRPLFDGPLAWFPTEVSGLDTLPPPAALMVGNHSGGTTIPDIYGLAWVWYRHFGLRRPLSGLAHELVFLLGATGRRFSRWGALRADRELARTALAAGRDLMVMPGGDLDTWRPWRDRWRVRFDGRRGYARLAIEAGVPVVPVAHAGAHHTLVVLTDGRQVARRLGFQRAFRAEVFPVHLSLPWGLTVGPFPHLPPPTRLRWRFGAAIPPPVTVAPGEPVPEEAVIALDEAVRAALQAELDVLRAEAPGWRARMRRVAERWRAR